MLSKREIPQFIDKKALTAQLLRILDISSEGLKARGKDEEKFLAPLYECADRLTNPSRDMLEGIKNGLSLIHFIEQYSEI